MRCKTCGTPLDKQLRRCEKCGAEFDPDDPRTFEHEGGGPLRVAKLMLKWALIVGGIGFALGFCGPIVLSPQSNQGPLLGIFITGPIGFAAGAIIGLIRALMHERD